MRERKTTLPKKSKKQLTAEYEVIAEQVRALHAQEHVQLIDVKYRDLTGHWHGEVIYSNNGMQTFAGSDPAALLHNMTLGVDTMREQMAAGG